MKEGNEWVNLAEKSGFAASSAIQGKTGDPLCHAKASVSTSAKRG